MIYLDTHVVVWLYEGLFEKLSPAVIELIENNELLISPMVKLELVYLHEIKKSKQGSQAIIHHLQTAIGLKVCDLAFEKVINKAQELSWTSDPFDRLICAQALCKPCRLVTKDKLIRKHLKLAVWD